MIKICNLCKQFNNKDILINIDLEIKKDEVMVILGASGSGKSTLLRCINYLENHNSGKIFYKEKEITKKYLYLYRSKVGLVFQSFNLFNNMNVLDNIIFAALKLKLLNYEEAINIAEKLLNKFNLIDKKNSFPDELSGGQKQRVAIIRAILLNPEFIMFDEPTSALDPKSISDVYNLFLELKKEKIGIIVVTHELEFAKKIADKIVFLHKGRITESGTPKEIFKNPKSKELIDFLKVIEL